MRRLHGWRDLKRLTVLGVTGSVRRCLFEPRREFPERKPPLRAGPRPQLWRASARAHRPRVGSSRRVPPPWIRWCARSRRRCRRSSRGPEGLVTLAGQVEPPTSCSSAIGGVLGSFLSMVVIQQRQGGGAGQQGNAGDGGQPDDGGARERPRSALARRFSPQRHGTLQARTWRASSSPPPAGHWSPDGQGRSGGCLTVAQALNHPTWKMGRKITVDSATLMNKADPSHRGRGGRSMLAPSALQVVVHPQSVIHSMVEYVRRLRHRPARRGRHGDSDPLRAHLSTAAALSRGVAPPDAARLLVSFEEPDTHRFPRPSPFPEALEVAIAPRPSSNAANEVAAAALPRRADPIHPDSRAHCRGAGPRAQPPIE